MDEQSEIENKRMHLFTIQQRYKYYFSCCIFLYTCVFIFIFFLVRIYPSELFLMRLYTHALFSYVLFLHCAVFQSPHGWFMDSAKQFFLGDPSFRCNNLFTSSSGTNEIFTNLLYNLTPYHIYKKKSFYKLHKKLIYNL